MSSPAKRVDVRPADATRTGAGAATGSRHVLVEIFYDPNHADHQVLTQPRMICLNSVNGDTVQWYAAGGDFTVFLGNGHPFDFNGNSIEVSRGQYSPVLRFRTPGQPTGLPGLAAYEVVRGRAAVRVPGSAATSHPGVIFDP